MGLAEVEFVMRELGYHAARTIEGVVTYESRFTPEVPVWLDLRDEDMSREDLRQNLLDNGFPDDVIAAAFEQLG